MRCNAYTFKDTGIDFKDVDFNLNTIKRYKCMKDIKEAPTDELIKIYLCSKYNNDISCSKGLITDRYAEHDFELELVLYTDYMIGDKKFTATAGFQLNGDEIKNIAGWDYLEEE